MLVMEDGARLRLLAGIASWNPQQRDQFRLERTPTRFGRVTVNVEPLTNSSGSKADTVLDLATRPASVEIPSTLCGGKFDRLEGAKYQVRGSAVLIDPTAAKWTAFWR